MPVRREIKRLVRRLTNGALRIVPVRRVARYAARCGLLPARVWTGYPYRGVIEVQAGDARFLYEVVPGDYVGMPLYWLGFEAYEPETMQVFSRLARDARVLFDIGANTGLFSLFAAALNPAIRVVAFEPVPSTFRQLERQIALNSFEDRVRPVERALGDAPGELAFGIPEGVFPTSAGFFLEERPGGAHTTVTVVQDTLDAFCRSHYTPDLVKIDVEGHEDRVLAGMRDLLGRAPPTIILECLHDGPWQAIEAALAGFGYRFGHLAAGGVQWGEHIDPREAGTGRNWLCIPPGREPPP